MVVRVPYYLVRNANRLVKGVVMAAVHATTLHLDITAGLIRSAALIQDIHASVSAEHGLTPQHAQLMCVVGDQPSSMVQLARISTQQVRGKGVS
jgi:hypothetical protein